MSLSVTGVAEPTCVVRVASVNGVDIAPGTTPPIAPLDNIVLALAASPATLDSAIAEYQWSLLGRPASSCVTLLYQVRGSVYDADGIWVRCELSLQVGPAS